MTQENPSRDEVLGLEDDGAIDDGAIDDDASEDDDDAERTPRDLRDDDDVLSFDDHAADASEGRELDLPDDDAHFEDRARRSPSDDEPRGDDPDAFGSEYAFDDDRGGKDRADRGVEGLDGEEAEVDEDALPAMDADTAGEFELTDLLAELGFGAAREFVVGAVHEIGPVDAVAVGESGFCAGGATAAFFEGASGVELRRWPRAITRIERAEDGFVVVDGEAASHVVVAQGVARPATVRAEGSFDQLVVVGGELVARISGDVVLLRPSGERTVLFRDAASIGASSSTLVVATLRGSIVTRRGPDGAITEHGLDGAAASAFAARAQILACDPKQCLVRPEAGDVLWVRPGQPTEALSLPGTTTLTAACSAGLGFEFLVVIEEGERVQLAAPHAPSSELHLLADLSSTFTGGVRAIRWDELRHEVVIAGAVGVARVRALAPH